MAVRLFIKRLVFEHPTTINVCRGFLRAEDGGGFLNTEITAEFERAQLFQWQMRRGRVIQNLEGPMNLSWFMILAVLLLTAGCRTSSLASRKALHLAAYSALPLEMQRLVDQGQLRAGMDTDAVFIAWGPPAKSVSRDGATMIWLYTGGWVQKIPYWSFTPNRYGFGTLDLRVRPVARGYVRAEVVFQNGRVISWRTFAAPDD